MGYTAAEAHVHADELGDTFTDDMVERIHERLGNPERCPHGWPIDTDVEQAENQELEPLSALEPGARATIVRLAEHDGDLLHWFYDEGLVPGASVELDAAAPGRGPASRPLERRRAAPSRRQGRRRPVRPAEASVAPQRGPRGGAEPGGRASASALSTRSHVKSGSSRPKWP